MTVYFSMPISISVCEWAMDKQNERRKKARILRELENYTNWEKIATLSLTGQKEVSPETDPQSSIWRRGKNWWKQKTNVKKTNYVIGTWTQIRSDIDPLLLRCFPDLQEVLPSPNLI